jgi:hypothetical protein
MLVVNLLENELIDAGYLPHGYLAGIASDILKT